MKLTYEQAIYALRATISLFFLLCVGGVFLYSQFSEHPINLETISALLGILLPYFGLDTLVSYKQLSNTNKE